MLMRVLEPELMDTAEEAEEYDRIDHRLVNERFVADFLSAGELRRGGTALRRPLVLDVGSGTARVPVALCDAWPDCDVMAVDMAAEMLRLGVAHVRRAQLTGRILCPQANARRLPFRDGLFPFVISNSLLHHLPDPASALAEMCRVAEPGGLLFVRDLARPATTEAVERLVATYTAYETPVQRGLFAASLCAALTLEEMRVMVEPLALERVSVVASSDRHWTLTATRA